MLARRAFSPFPKHYQRVRQLSASPGKHQTSQDDLYKFLRDRSYDFSCREKLRYESVSLRHLDLRQYEMDVDASHLHFALGHDEMDKVRAYMVDTFYREAPVPRALRLADTLSKHDYLQREINSMLEAGLGQWYEVSGEMIGAGVNAAWEVDKDYDAFPVSATDWLNVGARIASEKTSDAMERTIIWRDFQYQLTFHLAQGVAQQRGVQMVLYAGASYVDPKFRIGKTQEFLASFARIAAENDALFFFVGTIPNFEKNILKSFSSVAKIVDVANFCDLHLELEPGEGNIFEPLKDKDGLVFTHAAH